MRSRYFDKALTPLEFAVSFIIIAVFSAALIALVQQQTVIARQNVLRVELQSLRLTLNLYKALNGNYPEDLKALIEAKYKMSATDEVIFGKHFLEALALDKNGYPEDPFGNRFCYDFNTGVIYSQTKGYENW